MRYLKKSLGQNILIDKNIIRKIVNLVDIKNKNVIEIGPGDGALTDEILRETQSPCQLLKRQSFCSDTQKEIFKNQIYKNL